jgi:hypothetical protein
VSSVIQRDLRRPLHDLELSTPLMIVPPPHSDRASRTPRFRASITEAVMLVTHLSIHI